MGARRLVPMLAALVVPLAWGVDTAQWPPPSPVEDRMHELQHVIGDPQSTPGERQAAREELVNLLKSPAGQVHGATPAKPARAAIQPLGPIVKPATDPPIAAPPVAHIEVTQPPKPAVAPNGSVAVPTGNGFAVDPRSGHVLREVPGGYVDPRSGQFTPAVH